MNSPSKKKIIAYVIAIFIAGLLAGGLAGFSMCKKTSGNPPPPQEITAHIVKKLKSKLDLSEDQIKQIEPEIRQTADQISLLHSNLTEQTITFIKLSNAKVETHLTPDQKKKYVEMEQEREERFSKMRKQK